MYALDYFREHHRTINFYLVVYSIVLALVIALSLWLFRTNRGKPLFAGLFYCLLIIGALLIASALYFRQRNLDEISLAQQHYSSNPVLFLEERMAAASTFEAHFFGLLQFWLISMGILIVLLGLFYRRKAMAGVLIGLLMAACCSLTLDYFGFTADRVYFDLLNKLADKGIQLEKR